MALIRKVMRLEQYLTWHHFNNLAKLLLLMSLLWFYFTMAENLTVWYGNEPEEMAVFGARTRGHYAPYFWAMVVLNFVVPFVLLGIRRLRTFTTATIASVCVLIGMWLERYFIVVPTLANPRLTRRPACTRPLGWRSRSPPPLSRHGLAVPDLFEALPDHRGVGVQTASARGGLMMYLIGGVSRERVGTGAPSSGFAPAVSLRTTWMCSPKSPWSCRGECWIGPATCLWLGGGRDCGGWLATAFVYWAQNNYKLVTGGMPIFSFWATGVITYEMTMLGAIITTFAVVSLGERPDPQAG